MPSLDSIDIGILSALRRDGRLSNKELAASVGLAPSSCLERVRRLQKSGALRGTHAEADLNTLGVHLQALVFVRLLQHDRQAVSAFQAHLAELPAVLQVFYVGGAEDFVVHVAARSSDQLRDLVLDGFSDRREVRHVRTELLFEHQQRWELPFFSDQG